MKLALAAVVAIAITCPAVAQERPEEDTQALAQLYESVLTFANLGFLDPALPQSFAMAADLGTECSQRALQLCGKGKTCCFCACDDGNTEVCSFSCRQEDGTCQPCPSCGCNQLHTTQD